MRVCAGVRAALFLFFLVAAGGTARADDPALAEAEAHFLDGKRLYDASEFDRARAEFEKAYAIKPNPVVRYFIALSYERIYKPKQALVEYQKFLDESRGVQGLRDALGRDERDVAEARVKVLRNLPGSIYVSANEPDAHVVLDGPRHAEATAPVTFTELPPGEYRLHVALAEHKPYDATIRLEPGDAAIVPARLDHLVGLLIVDSMPLDARVFVDDRDVGETPDSIPVESGHHKLRLELRDFPPFASEIDVRAGHTTRFEHRFRRPAQSGRAELVLASMAYGSFAGMALIQALGADTSNYNLELYLLSGVGGVGAGFLGAWLLTDDYVKVGHSSMIIGSTAWGTLAGLGFGLVLDPAETRDYWALMLAGGAAGLATGIAVARVNDTSPGDAAIVNSGGMWGAMTGLLMTEAIGVGPRDHQLAQGALLLGGTALGVTAGALTAWLVETSRGHVAVVDVGGLAGLAVAFGIGYGLADSRNPNGPTDTDRLVAGARWGLGGMGVGLLAAAVLSRNYKDDLPPTESLMSLRDGRLRLGVPSVAIGPGSAGVGTQLTLTVAKGTW